MGKEKLSKSPPGSHEIDTYSPWAIRTIGTLAIAVGSLVEGSIAWSLITNYENIRPDSALVYGLLGIAAAVFGGFAFSRVDASKKLRKQK